MEKLKIIVQDAMSELDGVLDDAQRKEVARVMEASVIRALLEGQHRAVDAAMAKSEVEQDMAHKIANSIRKKNDALIVNLSSLR